MMFWQLTIDANDPPLLARFWARALDYQPAPPAEPRTTWNAHYRDRLEGAPAFTDRIFDPAGLRPPIWFQQVPEGKAGKNRLHLDLYPTGRDDSLPLEQRAEIVDAKVDELVEGGARVVHRERGAGPEWGSPRASSSGGGFYFVVLNDPEGNEFCVS
ncbi:VOC family protein [Streptomyces odontomachi]|uniref:VOC family protein n=1 Tax=Streptomyces odontomachi TaxID=2944940 RepID=UPI00210B26D4|nr:VOC family protein [Streptomyces sp. ODS25]